MNIRKTILIDRPILDVWEVLGNQFGEAYKWATGLYHSNAYGHPQIDGASCSNRSCDTNQGKINEELRKYDAENYMLEYEIVEGFPFFVDTATNNWRLTKEANSTRLDIDFNLKTKGWVGAIMKPMMKMQMNKVMDGITVDFKHYVEKGKPSPQKAKELLKLSKKAA